MAKHYVDALIVTTSSGMLWWKTVTTETYYLWQDAWYRVVSDEWGPMPEKDELVRDTRMIDKLYKRFHQLMRGRGQEVVMNRAFATVEAALEKDK